MAFASKVFLFAATLSVLSSAADCDGKSDETSLLQLQSSVRTHRRAVQPQPDDGERSAEWVMNNTGYNVTSNTRWTDYDSSYRKNGIPGKFGGLPPPLGNPTLDSLASLAEKDSDEEEATLAAEGDGDDGGRDAVWVFNNTGFNVTEKTRWTDYISSYRKNGIPGKFGGLPPPLGNPTLDSLASLIEQGNDTATNWTQRWTNYLPPYGREQYPPLEPAQVVPTLMQEDQTPFNDSDVNWTERWENYLPPHRPENWPPLEPEEITPSADSLIQEGNDTATNWTQRWTNYLPPYGREQYPPLEPAEVTPTLLQQTPFNDSDVNWTERWENYLPPHRPENWPPLEPEEITPSADSRR